MELSHTEVEQIAEALVFDGHVAKVFTLGEGGKTVAFYHALKNQPTPSGINALLYFSLKHCLLVSYLLL